MNLHMWELQQCLDACVEKDEKSLQQLQIVIYECTWENLTYSTSIYAVCVCVRTVPVFGEDPETLSEHSIFAVSHG